MQPGTVIKTIECVHHLVHNCMGVFENRKLIWSPYRFSEKATEIPTYMLGTAQSPTYLLTGKSLCAGWTTSENDDQGPIWSGFQLNCSPPGCFWKKTKTCLWKWECCACVSVLCVRERACVCVAEVVCMPADYIITAWKLAEVLSQTRLQFEAKCHFECRLLLETHLREGSECVPSPADFSSILIPVCDNFPSFSRMKWCHIGTCKNNLWILTTKRMAKEEF